MTNFRNQKPKFNEIGELQIKSKRSPEEIVFGKADQDNQVPVQVRSMASHYIFPIDAKNLPDVINHLTDQLKAFKKAGVLSLLLLIMAFSGMAQDFTPVWDGNGFGHMNIYVKTANIDNEPIQPGDKIGIFSGDKCVGYTTVQANYPHKAYLVCDVITSMDDGSGNGFTQGAPITVKLWDSSANKYVDVINTSYFDDLQHWVTDGTFLQGGSAFIGIDAQNIIKKKILLKRGFNTLEVSLNPSQTSLPAFFDALIKSGALLKVQDAQGRSFEPINASTWINSIGTIQQHSKYVVSVNTDCELNIQGLVK